MTSDIKPKTPDAMLPKKRELHVTGSIFRDAAHRAAVMATSPVIRGALTGIEYAERGGFGKELDLTSFGRQLREQADAVNGGNMAGVESMLLTQANTLDAIFNQLARKAADSEYMNQMEANLRMALKAQQQSAATLRVLGELKAPKQISFVKQQNTGQNVQVNNGVAPPTVPRAHGESGNQSNELLEHQHGERMDTGAEAEAARSDQALAAVDPVNGTGDRCG